LRLIMSMALWMSIAEWGILGSMEAARQALVEAWPEGLTRRQLLKEAGLDETNWATFIMQMSRFCYIYEEQEGRGTITYFVDPVRDEQYERRILPYDRLDRE
jgi:hypothetical protein